MKHFNKFTFFLVTGDGLCDYDYLIIISFRVRSFCGLRDT